MADDAGALLVRSGLVSSNALDDARARVASIGGTLGEQLVATGVITDDDLTDFYRSRLLVPQVNANLLARLTPKVVATIPSDMAIELRAIPVSLDGDNNLTVAMSDPSDRHAVDEIAFFTGTYVVRAVATQMQIAWCLAHYYGHVTALGQRLLYAASVNAPANAPVNAPVNTPVNTPVNAPVSSARPAPTPPTPTSMPASAPRIAPASTPVMLELSIETSAPTPPTPVSVPASAPHTPPTTTPAAALDADYHTPVIIVVDDDDDTTPRNDEPPVRRVSSPGIRATSSGGPDHPRARSISGEIRVPVRRAASIRPPIPQPDPDDDEDDDEPLIVIEAAAADDTAIAPRAQLPRRRAVKSDPPELYARAGEVDLKTGDDHSIDANEPRIVIDEDALATPTAQMPRRDAAATLLPAGDPFDDADTAALLHDRVADDDSQPILLERPRPTSAQLRSALASDAPAAPGHVRRAPDVDTDIGETSVVVLEAKKPRPRSERRTQVGIPPAPVPVTRAHRDTEATGIPTMLEHPERDRTAQVDDDATTLDINPAPRDDAPTSERHVAPPAPASYDDSNPHIVAPPPRPAPPRTAAIQQAVIIDDEPEDEPDDSDDDASGLRTSVMTAVELDDAIPERTAEVDPAPPTRRHVDYDPIDDGWGPPGTTIPPPLLGAIPGSDDDDEAPSAIPMPDVDSLPLMVGPPSLPSAGDAGGRALVRALEDATAQAIEMIRKLEHAESRDEVVSVMVAHLAETHHRAGFFVTRHGSSKDVVELSLFSMTPRPAVMPYATLRLDRPSTLQDVVGTRLPYPGPMHDDASRTFLISILGACPPEILLVPVAVRERVVGVLFGEHRQRHTFDDQLALAARAAGMALERILKAKRG